jgi:hypothetical protein
MEDILRKPWEAFAGLLNHSSTIYSVFYPSSISALSPHAISSYSTLKTLKNINQLTSCR